MTDPLHHAGIQRISGDAPPHMKDWGTKSDDYRDGFVTGQRFAQSQLSEIIQREREDACRQGFEEWNRLTTGAIHGYKRRGFYFGLILGAVGPLVVHFIAWLLAPRPL